MRESSARGTQLLHLLMLLEEAQFRRSVHTPAGRHFMTLKVAFGHIAGTVT